MKTNKKKIAKKIMMNGGLMSLVALSAVLAPGIVKAEELLVTNEATLTSCITAEDTNVCKLQNDIATTTWVMPTATKTLDLAGHTIDMTDGSIWISEGENLTITGNGTINTKSAGYATVFINKNGSVNLESGTLNNSTGNAIQLTGNKTEDKVYAKVGKDAVINGSYGIAIHGQDEDHAANNVVVDVQGTINAENMGITTNGHITSKNTTNKLPEINVLEGAKILSTDGPAIYAAGTAKWNIKGGNLTGLEALSIKAGTFKVSGGKFTATGEKVDDPEAFNNGSEDTGAAISVTANSAYDRNVTLDITGGEFISQKGYALYEGMTSANNTAIVEISIDGGTFTAEKSENAAVKITSESDALKNFITGGAFSSEIDDAYLDENVEMEDGEVAYKKADYTKVDEQIDRASKLDETKYTEESYKSLKDALEAVDRDKNVTEQEEVDEMAKAIEEAIEGLVEKTEDTKDPSDTENPDDNKGSEDDKNDDNKEPEMPNPDDEKKPDKNPQTLDGIVLYAGLAVASVAGAGVVLKKHLD